MHAALVAHFGQGPEKSIQTVVSHLLQESVSAYSPPPAEIARMVLQTRGFNGVLASVSRRKIPVDLIGPAPAWQPAPAMAHLSIPELRIPADLAEWLVLSPEELRWFADTEGWLARGKARRFGHYLCFWQPKRSGGHRLIEAPLPRLKAIQRRILDGILAPVPLHPDAFGFAAGRNCRMAAQRHCGEQVVMCFDLQDFFGSVTAARVHGLFRTLGYPWAVARDLTGLVTTRTHQNVLLEVSLPHAQRQRLRQPHLPQGSPCSPALANLAAWRLDRRLSALARQAGAAYSRYADDLTFSGDADIAFERGVPLREIIGEIAAEEGFALNLAKTRLQHASQRQAVTGIVVNRHLNLPRNEFDRLKAILHNCRRFGPESQNREGIPNFRAHLDGRIGWVEQLNPGRGSKLRAMFAAIRW